MNKPDFTFFNKQDADKCLTSLGRFMKSTGAMTQYLNWQTWESHFRWWHPITIIIILWLLVLYILISIIEAPYQLFVRVKREMIVKKCDRGYCVSNALDMAVGSIDFVAQPVRERDRKMFINKRAFNAKTVIQTQTGKRIDLSDKVYVENEKGGRDNFIVHGITLIPLSNPYDPGCDPIWKIRICRGWLDGGVDIEQILFATKQL